MAQSIFQVNAGENARGDFTFPEVCSGFLG
jgi:hypothetical protein